MVIPAILMSVAGGVLSGVIQKAIEGSGATEAVAPQTLDKDDFLRLLTAQLRNQDPLNPVSNTEFLAQTAQFSTLEQLQNMNKTLERLLAQAGGAGPASAAALLGRGVTVNGSPLNLEGGRPAGLQYSLPTSATSVFLQVEDEKGNPVRTIGLGQQGAGPHEVIFDGLDEQGRRLASGTYTYRVLAINGAGTAVPGAITGGGVVTGINVENGQLVLLLGEQRVPLTSVIGLTAAPAL